jgi:hypothetical protein
LAKNKSAAKKNSKKSGMAKTPKTASDSAPWIYEAGLNLLLRFHRFGWEVGGVIFLGLAGVTLLTMIGLTSGAWVTAWASWLVRWFGIGKYLIVASLIWGGVWMLYVRRDESKTISWSRVIGVELSFFSLLGLLSLVGVLLAGENTPFTGSDIPLTRAEAGYDGGLVGWGITKFLRIILGSILPDTINSWVLPIVLSLAAGCMEQDESPLFFQGHLAGRNHIFRYRRECIRRMIWLYRLPPS